MKTKAERKEIDKHVGQQLKKIRSFRGISQQKLSDEVDLTFQQLQKYEKGSNRISASVLYDLAHILRVKISTFFEGLDDWSEEELPKMKKEHYQLIISFDKLEPKLKTQFLNIIRAASDN